MKIQPETTDPDVYRLRARSRPFKRKLDEARRALEEAGRVGSVAVAMSYGKDSIAVGALALEVLGPVPVMHQESSYRLPGWEPVQEYFRARTTVHTIPAKRTLEETIAWLHEVGLGYERETTYSSKTANRAKRDLGDAWCETHGINALALGLRAEESKVRKMVMRKRGLVYQLRSGQWRVQPIGWWTVADVWALIFSRELPYPRVYDCESHGYTRENLHNTGWLTTIGARDGRIAWLRHHFPEQYRALVREFPRVQRLS